MRWKTAPCCKRCLTICVMFLASSRPLCFRPATGKGCNLHRVHQESACEPFLGAGCNELLASTIHNQMSEWKKGHGRTLKGHVERFEHTTDRGRAALVCGRKRLANIYDTVPVRVPACTHFVIARSCAQNTLMQGGWLARHSIIKKMGAPHRLDV